MKPLLIVIFGLSLVLFGSTLSMAQSSDDFAEVKELNTDSKLLAHTDPLDLVDDQVEAVPLNYEKIYAAISYPRVAADVGVKGEVQVRILVNNKGRSIKYKIISSPDPVLSTAVLEQLPRLVFQPAMSKGIATRSWTNISFDFRIDK